MTTYIYPASWFPSLRSSPTDEYVQTTIPLPEAAVEAARAKAEQASDENRAPATENGRVGLVDVQDGLISMRGDGAYYVAPSPGSNRGYEWNPPWVDVSDAREERCKERLRCMGVLR